MRDKSALTLIEILVALALIGIVFAALAALQVQTVRASATARDVTQVKAEANRLLERILDVTTGVSTSTNPGLTDYAFSDYYVVCILEGDATAISNAYPGYVATDFDLDVPCGDTDSGSTIGFTAEARMNSDWSINPVPGGGVLAEGVMLLSVTTVHDDGSPAVTLGSAITCYDFFSGANAEVPEPCPVPQ